MEAIDKNINPKKLGMSMSEFGRIIQKSVEVFRNSKTVFDELKKVKPIMIKKNGRKIKIREYNQSNKITPKAKNIFTCNSNRSGRKIEIYFRKAKR